MNQNLKILYVEDEEDIRDEMLEILSLDFEEIKIAANGQEGLQIFKEFHPDIIISDIQMPLLDGISMAKEILAIDPKMKIVFTTAFNEESQLKRVKDLGIQDYITKPVNINKLLDTIHKITSS